MFKPLAQVSGCLRRNYGFNDPLLQTFFLAFNWRFVFDLLVGNPTSTGLIAFIYPCFSTSIGVQGRNMKFLLPSEFHSLNLFDDSGLFSETGVFGVQKMPWTFIWDRSVYRYVRVYLVYT